MSVTSQTFAPGFFQWLNSQPVATHVDFTDAMKNGTYTGLTTVPAAPGEFVISLIEVQDTTVTNPAADKKRPQPAPAKLQSTAKIVRILIGEQDRWQDKPLHQALVQALRANDIAGVTVYRGILGYGANRRMHKDSALHTTRPFC